MTSNDEVYRFPRTEEAPAKARRAVRNTILAWGLTQEIANTAELLVSELVTNVVMHAHGSQSCLVICQIRQEMVTVTVVDHGCGVPTRRESSETATNGRGLFLVEHMADDWGVRRVLRGKATYFSLNVPSVQLRETEHKPRENTHEQATRNNTGSARSAHSFRRRLLPLVVRPGW